MTVQELINRLEELPSELEVVVRVDAPLCVYRTAGLAEIIQAEQTHEQEWNECPQDSRALGTFSVVLIQ